MEVVAECYWIFDLVSEEPDANHKINAGFWTRTTRANTGRDQPDDFQLHTSFLVIQRRREAERRGCEPISTSRQQEEEFTYSKPSRGLKFPPCLEETTGILWEPLYLPLSFVSSSSLSAQGCSIDVKEPERRKSTLPFLLVTITQVCTFLFDWPDVVGTISF